MTLSVSSTSYTVRPPPAAAASVDMLEGQRVLSSASLAICSSVAAVARPPITRSVWIITRKRKTLTKRLISRGFVSRKRAP